MRAGGYFPNRSSAIFRAARLIGQIEEIAHRLNSSHHPAFDPPFTTLNLGIIEGGCAKNIIPGRCRFTLEWRPIPGQPSSHVIDLIQAEIEELRLREADFVCEINILRADEGVEMPMDSPLVRLLEEASGRGAGTVSFGTEAGQMVRLGAEAVVFGPGDIREAHRSGEFVPISELYGCVEVLRHAINRFCL